MSLASIFAASALLRQGVFDCCHVSSGPAVTAAAEQEELDADRP
jgi:hypothetical protein